MKYPTYQAVSNSDRIREGARLRILHLREAESLIALLGAVAPQVEAANGGKLLSNLHFTYLIVALIYTYLLEK